jgi:hypothetical protein
MAGKEASSPSPASMERWAHDLDLSSLGKGDITSIVSGWQSLVFVGTSRGFLVRVPLLCDDGARRGRLHVEVERAVNYAQR